MRRKQIVFTLVMIFSLLLASTCFAEEKPFGDITSTQDIIDKAFTGRTLDPIEGIWVRDEESVIAIVKTSVAFPNEKTQKYDYTIIKAAGKWKNLGEVWFGLNKTNYGFSFKGLVNYWKLLSPNLLERGAFGVYPVNPSETFVRIYPSAP